MRLQKIAVFLTAAVLVALVAALPALRGQNQDNPPPKEQQSNDNPFPIADYRGKDSVQYEKGSKRYERGKRYNRGSVQETGTGLQMVTISDDWEFRVPELPVNISDVIILGTILEAQALLSPDNSGVYSEFNVRVEEVLKDPTASVAVGNSVAVDREGGRVRYPSTGDIVAYLVSGKTMPRVNKRYVLFLKRQEESLSIITGYELRGGKVRPLDYPPKFKKFEGMSDNAFLEQIRGAVSPAPTGQGMGR